MVGDLGLIFGRTLENGRRQELGPVNSRGGVGICRHVYVEIARDILNRHAGRPAASHSAMASSDTLGQYWDRGDRLPIANEDDVFLVVFCTRRRLGETTAVLPVVGGERTTDDMAEPI